MFHHRQRRDQSASGGKNVRLVTIADHRPSLRLVWAGGAWELPAESYGLDYAPRIEPRFWTRKWMGTTRVDDWDRSSTGFFPGETTLALGRVTAQDAPEILELLPGERRKAVARWSAVERPRFFLILTLKLTLTLGLSLWLIPRGRRS